MDLGDARILSHVANEHNPEPTVSMRLCGNFYWAQHAAVFALAHCALYHLNRARFVDFFALRHYALVWAAIVTSPRGHQLDLWLLVMCCMDVLPLCFSLGQSWRLGLFSGEGRRSKVLLNMAYIMQDWSPAYQFNQLILEIVEGRFIDHVYVIMACTVLLTEGHKQVVKNMYCKTVYL